MKFSYILLFFIVFLFSCKDEVVKDKSNPKKETIVTDTKKKIYKGDYLYKAKVNINTGAILKDLISGEKLTEIPYGDEVLITQFHNFETIDVMNRFKIHGKWVRVVYQTTDGFLEGKIFDGYLDYEFGIKKPNIPTDTVVVKNEKEFFNALSSNRTIIIDAKEIDLDKGKLLIENSNYEGGFYGVSYSENYDETLILSDFNNLEIKGKNMVDFVTNKEQANVINFENCTNIYIDNINFYHKEVPNCGGDVLVFSECENLYFQNSHFDGSGLTAINAKESKNFNFLNCDFYNNHDDIVYSTDTNNIIFNRCDIYDNTLSASIFDIAGYGANRYVKEGNKIVVSDCFIIDNEVSSLIENNGNEKSVYKIENSLIIDNSFEGDMIDLVSAINIEIKNTDFISNISTSNKYFIDEHKRNDYADIKVSLENVSFKENIDFYNLSRDSKLFTKKENVIINDVFNRESDTLLNRFNNYRLKGVNYIKRSDEDFEYNKSEKEFSINGHLLQGLHSLNFSNNNFYKFKHNNTSSNNSYSGYGKIIDGKLTGEWKIADGHNTDFVEYENGELQQMKRRINVNRKTNEKLTVEKGMFFEGERDGIFNYYYEEGTIRKSITFKKGVVDYPQKFYFPSGQLRFTRTKNKSLHYHPNGTILAEIVYDDKGKFVMNESNYYDVNGDIKEAKETPRNSIKFHIDGGVVINFEGKELHNGKVFTRQTYDIAEFMHPNNSIGRYKVSSSNFLHESLKLKVSASYYAEFYVDDNDKFLYIFDRNHDLVYKAVTRNNSNLDLCVYNTNNQMKQYFKQYIIENKNYVLHGDYVYYNNGCEYYVNKYVNGKRK